MQKVFPKAIQVEGNPLWPLPPDYPSLSEDGQRQARVNATRLYLLDGLTKDQMGRTFVAVLNFFDRYYLWPDYEDGHEPQFYSDEPLPTPAFHNTLAYQAATEWVCTATCPRGSGKSTEIRKEALLQLVPLPGFSVTYCTSTHDNMMDTGETIKHQILFNKRLNDDFAPEYGGRLFHRRGQGSASANRMRLTNGSLFRGLSARSRIRSIRPDVFYLDDPEFDESASTSMSQIRAYMDRLITKVAMPAVTRAGSRLVWRNTFITKRHYAYTAMQGKIVGDTFVAEDPRFDFWHRLRIIAEVRNSKGETVSIWPEMWPLTKAERLKKAETEGRYAKAKSLEEIKRLIGIPNYNSEYLAKPGDSDTAYLSYDLNSRGPHAYWLESVDSMFESEPRISQTMICWQERKSNDTFELKRMPLFAFLSAPGHILFQTGDTSNTAGPTSDYKATVVMCVTPNNDLFILDLWAKKCPEPSLTAATFTLADRWRVPTIHAEAIREGVSYYQACLAVTGQRARELVQTKHLPRVHKVMRGHAEKTAFISALRFRFDHAQIKLPLWRRSQPMWDLLFSQIEDFNPEVDNGALEHDDLLDCVSMSNPVLHMRTREAQEIPKDTRTVLERLKDGDTHDPQTNLPYALGVNWLKVSVEDAMQVIGAHDARADLPPEESVI